MKNKFPHILAVSGTLFLCSFPAFGETRSSNMSCTPEAIKRGDTLSIGLPLHHGGDMAVVDPVGDYYFLAFTQPTPTSGLQPVVSPSLFLSMTTMTLDVAEAKGVPWSRSTYTPELIFKPTGDYRILVSKALESEDPILDGWCIVTFSSEPPMLAYRIYFGLNEDSLNEKAMFTLKEVAAIVGNQSLTVRLDAFADRSGPDAYNQLIAARRLRSTRDALVSLGIAPSSILGTSHGESDPLVPTADGRPQAQNRRVEITVHN